MKHRKLLSQNKSTLTRDPPTIRGRIVVARPGDCSGCKVCEMICSIYHTGKIGSSTALTHTFKDLFTGKYLPFTCQQCDDPKCVAACPEGAIYFDSATGGVVIDEDECKGHKNCMEACPYNKQGVVIRFYHEENIARQCDLCGGEPRCVEWCPLGILGFRIIKRKTGDE